jgi:integrase
MVAVMKRKLTELAIARLKPLKSGRLDVWDLTLPAFGIRITSTGARSYVVKVRKPGAKQGSRIKVGEPGAMSLAEARDKARAIMADPALLIPSVATDDENRNLLAAVIEQFIARDQKPRNRHWREVEQILRRELAPWLDRPIQSITKRDVIERLDAIRDRAPVRANRVLAHTRRLFGWALERDIVDASPVAAVRAPTREVARDRVLRPDELAAVWRASEALDWPFGPIVQLLALTAARKGEVVTMRWADLDLEARLWTVPKEMTKAGRVHEVPLSDLAMEVIAQLPRFGDGLLFPARKAGSTNPVSGFSKIKARLDQSSGIEDWRIHDLRRTAASGMARLGHPPHVVASVLGHSPGSTMGVTSIYNRHRYTDEKRAALAAWSREVERIIGRGEAKIVPLHNG